VEFPHGRISLLPTIPFTKSFFMAELNIAAGAGRHKGITRSKKLSTRVDLTPMVDLGFLLITFFVFTTTISQPSVMNLILPADTKTDNMPAAESTALTVIPIAGDKVLYYHGDLQKAEQAGLYGITDVSITGGIGEIIRQKQKALAANQKFKKSDLILIIRPMKDASYKTIVDVLDEVLINDLAHYSFVEITDEDLQFVQRRAPK
jgi:biopolymer transport protein ExbD